MPFLILVALDVTLQKLLSPVLRFLFGGLCRRHGLKFVQNVVLMLMLSVMLMGDAMDDKRGPSDAVGDILTFVLIVVAIEYFRRKGGLVTDPRAVMLRVAVVLDTAMLIASHWIRISVDGVTVPAQSTTSMVANVIMMTLAILGMYVGLVFTKPTTAIELQPQS